MNKTPTGETTKTESAGTARRREALIEVQACVCRDRQNTYGDAEDNFVDIAAYMTLWLRQRGLLKEEAHLQSFDVAQLSSFIKIARKAANPMYRDNWIDDAGYNVCGAGIVASQGAPRSYSEALEGLHDAGWKKFKDLPLAADSGVFGALKGNSGGGTGGTTFAVSGHAQAL